MSKYFPDAKVIKLEQNYRSTQNILDAANAVIKNNVGRKAKALWTQRMEPVRRLTFRHFDTAYDEAEYMCPWHDIHEHAQQGVVFLRMTVPYLYRTNAQSRLFEERFVTARIFRIRSSAV